MGFKGLSKFKEALLANRHGSCCMIKPHCFIGFLLFKAKYFQHCSVMEETNPSSASYAWKSVLRGREVIRRRGISRIGDGRSTAIWGSVGSQWSTLQKYYPPVLLLYLMLREVFSLIKSTEPEKPMLPILPCWVLRLIWLKKYLSATWINQTNLPGLLIPGVSTQLSQDINFCSKKSRICYLPSQQHICYNLNGSQFGVYQFRVR